MDKDSSKAIQALNIPAPLQMLLGHFGVDLKKITEVVQIVNGLLSSGAFKKIGEIAIAFEEIDVNDLLKMREDIRVIRELLEEK